MKESSQDEATVITSLPIERWREFRELRLRALAADPAAFGQTHAVALDYPEELWKSQLQDVHAGISWIVFAERFGNLLGMLGAFQTEDDRDRRNATVWGVFVDEDERGRGTGHALLAALL